MHVGGLDDKLAYYRNTVFKGLSSMDKALLVGINEYSSRLLQLHGCLYDVKSMEQLLTDHYGFRKCNMITLINEQATRGRILQSLKWLVDGAGPGDRLLFFFSGHGEQVPEKVPQSEVDGKDEAICCFNYDGKNHDHLIIDDELHEIFSKVPSGAHCVFISDSCHSGDLSEMGDKKSLWDKMLFKKYTRKSHNNLAFISGCRAGCKSTFELIEGKYRGALTYNLVNILSDDAHADRPLHEIVKLLRKQLLRKGLKQRPQLEGPKSILTAPFLGGVKNGRLSFDA